MNITAVAMAADGKEQHMIDIERIKARAEAATPIMLVGAMVSKNNAEFLKSAKGDVLALIAEVERLESEKDEAREIVKEIIALDAKHNTTLLEIQTAGKNTISQNKQLESEVEQLQEKYDHLETRYNILFTAFNKEIAETERLQSELATVTAERDAAVGDMKVSYKCCICKDYELCCKTPNMTPKCGINYLNFKWRGERSE